MKVKIVNSQIYFVSDMPEIIKMRLEQAIKNFRDADLNALTGSQGETALKDFLKGHITALEAVLLALKHY